MYQQVISTQDEAISHLFFHCCYKDGVFTEDEINNISSKIVSTGINAELNFTEQIKKYKNYRAEIDNEAQYLAFLVNLIRPTNELALFSYCVELLLSDSSIETSEQNLIEHLADALGLDENEKKSVQKLIVQRKIVETQKII